MKYLTIVLSLFILTLFSAHGQERIDVTEQTIKVGSGSDTKLYFGFAEGDKVIFNFKEEKNKKLQKIEIIEYPDNSKFADFKTSAVKDKTLNINKTGVYIFRFKNSAIGRRVCEIKIQRVPKSEETKGFDTTVEWINKQDTVWNSFTRDVIIGYDTTYNQVSKKELVQTEQREELVLSKQQRVHSETNPNGPKTNLFFTLPLNKSSSNESTKVVSWAYWVGVDDGGNKAWEQNVSALSNFAKGAASIYLTPLGALAVGAISDLAIPSVGEDVSYWITDQENARLFMNDMQFILWDKGKGVAGYQKFTDPSLCQGTYFILLQNDNVFQGIDANIKVIAILETSTFEDREYTEQVISPIIEKQIFKEPTINSLRVPVTK